MKYFVFILYLLFAQILFSEDLPDFRLGQEPARTYFKNGVSYLNNYQYGAAKENFLAALSILEDFRLARKFLSDTYFYGGEWQESLNELEILEKKGKVNQVWKNRSEMIRLLISGTGKKSDMSFFRHVSGDDFRGFRFRNPTDAYVDSDGNLYVLSFDTSNIIKFDPNGVPIGNYRGGIGRTLEGPLFLEGYKNNLYVSDFAGDRVYVISTKGDFLERFGGKGSETGKFHGPTGIAITDNDYIFIADSGNNRIQKFTLDGKFLQEFGKEKVGKENRSLANPFGIAWSEDSILYVADKDNKRILRYDEEGNFLNELTHPLISKPRSVKIHSGRLYVSDEDNGILIYSMNNDKWTKITTFRDNSGDFVKLLKPFSSAYDYTGTFYAVDYARHRVDIFAPKTSLSSNLDVIIEKVELSRFPNVSLFVRVKNRSNKDILGLSRMAFRVSENDNIYPLLGLANMKKFSDKLSVSLIFENSKKVKDAFPNLEGTLQKFFTTFTMKDQIEVIRAGKDSEKVYNFGRSPLDVLASIRKSQPETGFINLGKAIHQSITDVLPELGPRALILLVSGDNLESAFNQYTYIRNIQYASAHSVPIIILSLNDNTEASRVYKEIATRTGGIFLKVPGSEEENKLYDYIMNKKDNRYIISYKSKLTRSLADRYIDIQLGVQYRNIIGKSQTGYFVPEERN